MPTQGLRTKQIKNTHIYDDRIIDYLFICACVHSCCFESNYKHTWLASAGCFCLINIAYIAISQMSNNKFSISGAIMTTMYTNYICEQTSIMIMIMIITSLKNKRIICARVCVCVCVCIQWEWEWVKESHNWVWWC